MLECILADGVRRAQKMVVPHGECLGIQAPSRKAHQVPPRADKFYRNRLSLPRPNQVWEGRRERVIPPHGLREVWVVMIGCLDSRDESALYKVHSVIALPLDFRENFGKGGSGSR